MPTPPFRVAVWSTGGIGSIAIRAIHAPRRPRAGRRLGAQPREGGARRGRAGRRRPDRPRRHRRRRRAARAASSTASSTPPGPGAGRRLGPRLRALPRRRGQRGDHQLVGAAPPAELRAHLARRSSRMPPADGGASLYASGIEPGFAADQLPILLTTMSNSIRSIRASEIAHVRHLPGGVHDEGGHGLREAARLRGAARRTPGAILSAWGPVIELIAEALRGRARRDPRGVRPGGHRPHARGRVRHHRGGHRAARSARRPSAWSTAGTRS